MKKVFIPKGETVTYDQLNTLSIVVKGTLIVRGKLTASFIQGGGRVEAEEIQCDTMEVGTAQAEIVTARKVVGKKLFVRDLVATDAVMATDFIESLHVLTKSLFITLSSISQCDAEEIIMLSQKKRGLLGMLFASKIRSGWISMFHSRVAPKRTKSSVGKSRCNEEKDQASCRDTEIDIAEEDSVNNSTIESNPQIISEIMQYLDDNGYLKRTVSTRKQPDINVEYSDADADFATHLDTKKAVNSACEDAA